MRLFKADRGVLRFVASAGLVSLVCAGVGLSAEIQPVVIRTEVPPLYLTFSPDGETLASARTEEGTIRVWDLSQLPSEPRPEPETQPSPAGEKRQPPVLYGVTTSFTVAPAKIRSSGRVNVTWRMTNVTAKPVKFRYISEIVCHARLYDRRGRLVFYKDGVPAPEVPYLEVEIPAGQTIERSGGFVFGQWYSVRPGAYELRFQYDTRLMGDMRKDPWVPWSAAGCKLEILK